MTKKKPAPRPSPWRSGPHCPGRYAVLSYARYRQRGKRNATPPPPEEGPKP